MYEKTVKYVPFNKRFWDKAMLIVVLMGIQAIILGIVATVTQIWFLLAPIVVVLIGGGVNAYIFWKRMRYFLQHIKISDEQIVYVDLYYKDEPRQLTIPLHTFTVKFRYSGGKDRKTVLSLFDGNRLLAKQYDYGEWGTSSMGEVFRTIKQLKNEELSLKEERMLEGKGLFF
ncbi:hypothetical protein [Microscilla marina]|uniref:Uncharacterized protein n=1 Tax=Microscilla marina ATCC 23134 TaxID=313606 RepID=A1ZCG8_MICM2|nr:hypothetical protein [Microscilla marina]EAY31970.1 hypothetical protein M23134_01999 [Microscilla marina ATCC 23134]